MPGLEATWEEFTYCTPHRARKERRNLGEFFCSFARNARFPLESIENEGWGYVGVAMVQGVNISPWRLALLWNAARYSSFALENSEEVCPTKLLLPGSEMERL